VSDKETPQLREEDLQNLGQFESDSESDYEKGEVDDGSSEGELDTYQIQAQKKDKIKEKAMREAAGVWG